MAGYAGRDAVIVAAVRTPIGKGKASGALHDVLPVDLLAHSLRELVARTGIDPVQIDDVITGAVTQVGDQAVNIARNAAARRGIPRERAGHHRRPPVRQQPAGDSLRRPGCDRGRVRHRGRRGRGVDVAGADGLQRAAGQRPVRRDGASAIPKALCRRASAPS